MKRTGALPCAVAAALSSVLAHGPAAAVERGDSAFVVTYRCAGDRFIVAGYPPYRQAATQPVRLAWQGRSALVRVARSASGARYVSVSADLEWWTKGRGAVLNRLRSGTPILEDCSEE